MPNNKMIEQMSGHKVSEMSLKEGTNNVYIVVYDNNLLQDWKLDGETWTCLG